MARTFGGKNDGAPAPAVPEERRPASAGRRSGASGKAKKVASKKPKVTQRGQRTRNRILEAATELFSIRGFAGTRVDDVLQASGTGKSQFYHYFDNKADLGRAVLRHQRMLSIPRSNPDVGYLDTWDGIAAWFDDILRGATTATGRTKRTYGALSLDLVSSSEQLRAEFVRTAVLRRRLLSRGLRRMQRRGRLQRNADPQRLAIFAAAAIEGGLHFARIENTTEPLRHTLGETFVHLQAHAVPEDGESLPADSTEEKP